MNMEYRISTNLTVGRYEFHFYPLVWVKPGVYRFNGDFSDPHTAWTLGPFRFMRYD